MVAGVCTSRRTRKSGALVHNSGYVEHKTYYKAFLDGQPLTAYWHAPGELKQRNVWSLPECNLLFFASQEARHKHYLAYHKGSHLPADDQHV